MESYYLYFLSYSFLGWCMETTRFSFREKRFVNRGFLNGPLCPIYGTGMVIIIYFLEPYHNNIIILFFLGMIISTLLEYITGYLLKRIFKLRWWDYSNIKYNLNGYICLKNSLAWGVLCIIMLHFIQPRIEKLISYYNNDYLHSFVILTLVILIIDIGFTLYHLINLKVLISDIDKVKGIAELKMKESESLTRLHYKLKNDEIDFVTYIDEFFDKHPHMEIKARLKKRLAKKSRQLHRIMQNYHCRGTVDETANQLKKFFSK